MFQVCDYEFQLTAIEKSVQTKRYINLYDLTGRQITIDIFSYTVDALIVEADCMFGNQYSREELKFERSRNHREQRELGLILDNLFHRISALQQANKCVEQGIHWVNVLQDIMVDKIYLDYLQHWEKYRIEIEKAANKAISNGMKIDFSGSPKIEFFVLTQYHRYIQLEHQKLCNIGQRIGELMKGTVRSNYNSLPIIKKMFKQFNDTEEKGRIVLQLYFIKLIFFSYILRHFSE